MNLMDTIKKSLGFEIDESNTGMNRSNNSNRSSPGYRPNRNSNFGNNSNFNGNSRPKPKFDDIETIIPEQSFYEIVLIRPRTIDDINYVVDQILEQKNPVILDLSFLENESPANFKLAGEKIKQMRARYGAQALLLSRNSEKNLIILSPRKVKLINKN